MFARLSEAFNGAPKKKKLSIEELKTLFGVMKLNAEVTPANTNLVVETLRSIAEIVIWGDQNDPKVFEYFLENGMLGFFDQILAQPNVGIFINTQVLQTLNIMLDNIRTPTSIWFLLSNNHMNSLITHKFDFNEEEVLAYYISFLKSMSMKLTSDTILFFHNEHLPEFPLYSEAIKFFNHKESMVRVAVRTLTLQVFKAAIGNEFTEEFIVTKAVPGYFSNLVWVLGNLSIEMDKSLKQTTHANRGKLGFYVDEHLDLFCYMNDMIMLEFEVLTGLLSDQLLDSLLMPLYVHRICHSDEELPTTDGDNNNNDDDDDEHQNQQQQQPHQPEDEIQPEQSTEEQQQQQQQRQEQEEKDQKSRAIGLLTALFLSIHTFLIFDHPPMVNLLAATLLLNEPDFGDAQPGDAESLPPGLRPQIVDNDATTTDADNTNANAKTNTNTPPTITTVPVTQEQTITPTPTITTTPPPPPPTTTTTTTDDAVPDVVFRDTPCNLYNLIVCEEDDVTALQAMLLVHAMMSNRGMYTRVLTSLRLTRPACSAQVGEYNVDLVGRLVAVAQFCASSMNSARLITLNIACQLIQALAICPPEETDDDPGALKPPQCVLTPEHMAELQQANDSAVAQLAQEYEKHGALGSDNQERFLELFESEYAMMKPLKISLIMSQSSVLLKAATEHTAGVDFEARAPGSDLERVRRAIQIFLVFRKLWLIVNCKTEKTLPLRQPPIPISVRDSLDLNNSDLIACNVISRGKTKQLLQVRRFMMVDRWRLVLMEASNTNLGWGIVRFLANLNHVIACPESHNTRALQVVIRQRNRDPNSGTGLAGHKVLFSGRFVFDDHIRCVAALQYLERGRSNLRSEKIELLEHLIGLRSNDEKQ